jgi:hypothetical protein
MGFGGRHYFFRVIRMDAVMELTILHLTGNDHIVLKGVFANIQSKFRFPTLLVRPMTGIAFAGEQGAYFAVEVYFAR